MTESKHPRFIAAHMSHSPKLASRASGLTKAEVRAIRDLQAARRSLRDWQDPLISASFSRRFRTPAAEAKRQAAEAERRAWQAAELEAALAAGARRQAARQSLLRAARTARAMGFLVRASRNRAGLISSYYIRHGDGPQIRISDHEIPETGERLDKAAQHGAFAYDGYRGPEILITQARSSLWICRALTLAAAGRAVQS